MERKRNLKLKKFNIHPIITFIILTIVVLIGSGIFSLLQIQTTYSKVNIATLELETVLVSIENLFNYNGIKYIISNAARNFVSFAPLSNLIIALLGLSVAQASGLIDTLTKRISSNVSTKTITFFLILVATISSLINDVGYVILIPLGALIFKANNRNPMLGIIASFCGVAFGYGATIFIGSAEINLISDTTAAARLIDTNFHVNLTSNLIIMIISTIVVSIVGTYIIEKVIAPKIGKIKSKEDNDYTKEIDLTVINETEQNKIELEFKENKGLKKSLIVGMVFLLCFMYMLIPSLPFSGLLLDMNENTYLKQIFGENSYFQDGFTYMVSLFFLVTGVAYAIGAKTIKNSKDLIEKSSMNLENIGQLIALMFFASQFIAIFKKSNIGSVIVALITKMISQLSFSGLPLIILVMILIGICNLFVTTAAGKWSIMAPVVVPLMMQSNIDPQFSQFILRAADSMTKGITPLLAYFVVYIGYLNIYNKTNETITIKKAVSYIMPYCLIISLCWMLLIIGWYLLGAPIGIGVNSTL